MVRDSPACARLPCRPEPNILLPVPQPTAGPGPSRDHHRHAKRHADPRGHHRPRLRGRIHPDLPGLSRRRGLGDLPAVAEGPRRVRRPLEDRQAVHRLRPGPGRPRRRRGPHQLADPGPRLAVDRRARGGQARRLHRADGHDRRGVRQDRRRPAEVGQGLHDDGDRGLQPRIPLRQGPLRQGRTRQDPVPPGLAPAGHGRLARLLGGPAPHVLRHPLREPLPGPARPARRARRLPRLGADRPRRSSPSTTAPSRSSRPPSRSRGPTSAPRSPAACSTSPASTARASTPTAASGRSSGSRSRGRSR